MTTEERCKVFEAQVEEYASKVRARIDKSETLTEGEKGTVVECKKQGWMDGWVACVKKEGKMDVVYLIQDAISYFANVCPRCEQGIEWEVDPEEIKTWLEGKDDPA